MRDIGGRAILTFAHDLAASGIAWLAAGWIVSGFAFTADAWRAALGFLPWVLGAHALAFALLRLHRAFWRYTNILDLQRVVAATVLGAVASALAARFVALQGPAPAFIVMPLVLAALMCGSRLVYRATSERRWIGAGRNSGASPVVVLGAGAAASALLHELAGSPQRRVVALLDDDPRKQGGAIQDVKVLGALDRVGDIAARLGVSQAVIAMPGASHGARKRALELCQAAGLQVMTVPAYGDIVAGKVSVSQLRNVELDDLLGRDPVQLDDAKLSGFLRGRSVLVTGAGGSIGSELCRQIARFAPARLVLVENSEFALYSIEQELRERQPELELVAAIADAKDAARVGELFGKHRPEVVFHAAAYKHVPLMERDNAYQAVANNALSTIVAARAAQSIGARAFVLVSTDKAVNPTNVMGASKRLAELICQALQPRASTQFVMVRFGNVLGSTGSVIPRFREQIARGGPVTVTHPDIERYFMSIPEAAQLVLQAALMGEGGQIFVLDMGQPVKIVDLARQMIRLSGFTDQDIRISFTGLRPGEKLFEEVLVGDETTLPTPHPKLRVARARAPERATLPEEVLEWLERARKSDAPVVRAKLKEWIAEYTPGE